MSTPRFILLALGTLLPAFAQLTEFRSDVGRLSPAGGQVKLTAAVTYEDAPGAIGWSITLPVGWKLVALSGPHLPAVAPEIGSTGQLDFAYSVIPAQRAEFSLAVSYPAGADSGRVPAVVIVRRDGKLTTLAPEEVSLSR